MRRLRLLALLPLVELLLLVEAGRLLGAGAVAALIVVPALLGLAVVRYQGMAALRRLRHSVNTGGHPGDDILDGALVVVGGVLLIVPGPITDLLGLVVLVPWGRRWVRSRTKEWLRRRLLQRNTSFHRAVEEDRRG
jgi:UPF0716 protein FxsA